MIEYRDEASHFCYPVMRSDIADCAAFSGKLEAGRHFDLATPYGYGGPLSDGEVPEASQKRFISELTEYCLAEGAVSQFIRFHPLLGNERLLSAAAEMRYIKDTVYIDTSSRELIMQNMDCKRRNSIRKAIKLGVTVEVCDISDTDDFRAMYYETMRRDNADGYYFFDGGYFEQQKRLGGCASMYYALHGGERIAGAIIYRSDRYMHYHLSGSRADRSGLGATDLLLYTAACHASEAGIGMFHLGGGSAAEDSLFQYKKKFNRHGRLRYYVGRSIFDKEGYERLLAVRKSIDPDFDRDNGRMIQYR